MSNPSASQPINGMPPIHPGEFLAEILGDLKMSQAEFARVIGVSPMRISHVVREERPVTADLALRFGHAFGQSPQMWSSWQADYDLKIAQSHLGKDLNKIPRLAA